MYLWLDSNISKIIQNVKRIRNHLKISNLKKEFLTILELYINSHKEERSRRYRKKIINSPVNDIIIKPKIRKRIFNILAF